MRQLTISVSDGESTSVSCVPVATCDGERGAFVVVTAKDKGTGFEVDSEMGGDLMGTVAILTAIIEHRPELVAMAALRAKERSAAR